MFAIEVELLTGRYYATEYNDRARPEWPPHPARLFSALVATHYADESPPGLERAALQWLERQGPPEIAASPHDEVAIRETYTAFVPVNDAGVIPAFDEEVLEIARARRELSALSISDPAPKRGSPAAKAAKELEVLQRQLARNMEKALAPGKVSDQAMQDAEHALPETRVRQPRTFPSVKPELPVIQYVWPTSEPEPEHRAALTSLAPRLVRLGHSASLVRARVVDSVAPARWRPEDSGTERLRVVQAGQLSELDEAFGRHQETEPRILPAVFTRYSSSSRAERPFLPASIFGDDWIVFRRVDGPRLPSTSAVGLAIAVRRALLHFAGDSAPEALTGHAAGGHATDKAHLAILPLPFVADTHADGSFLGVALVVPPSISHEDRRAIYLAVDAWESAERKREEDEGSPVVPVHLGETGTLRLQRVEGRSQRSTLRPETWCHPSKRWATATPIALDRHPGDLRDRNPDRAARAAAEAAQSIAEACRRIGLPPPAAIEIPPHAPLAGAVKVPRFPRFPANLGRPQRALTHCRLSFEKEVRGPILLGAGRYQGLGLLRPVDDHE